MKGSILLACLAISFSSFAQEKTITLKDQESYTLTRDSVKDLISRQGTLEIKAVVSDATVKRLQNEASEKTKKEVEEKLKSEFSSTLKKELEKNTQQVSEQTKLSIKQDMKQEQAMRDQALNELKNDKKLISLLKESLTEEITPVLKEECMRDAREEYLASLVPKALPTVGLGEKRLHEIMSKYDLILIPTEDIYIGENNSNQYYLRFGEILIENKTQTAIKMPKDKPFVISFQKGSKTLKTTGDGLVDTEGYLGFVKSKVPIFIKTNEWTTLWDMKKIYSEFEIRLKPKQVTEL